MEEKDFIIYVGKTPGVDNVVNYHKKELQRDIFIEASIVKDAFKAGAEGTVTAKKAIQKMLDILFKDAGMPYDEGMEYLEFNTINAYVGEKTPIYLDDVSFVEFFEAN